MQNFLASFLITYYATNENLAGLFGVLDKFRAAMQVTETTKSIVGCPFCFSIYAAALVAVLPKRIVSVLAATGAVCLSFLAKHALDDIKDAAAWYSISQSNGD